MLKTLVAQKLQLLRLLELSLKLIFLGAQDHNFRSSRTPLLNQPLKMLRRGTFSVH